MINNRIFKNLANWFFASQVNCNLLVYAFR